MKAPEVQCLQQQPGSGEGLGIWDVGTAPDCGQQKRRKQGMGKDPLRRAPSCSIRARSIIPKCTGMNSGLQRFSVPAGQLLAPSLLKEGTRVRTLSPHCSGLCRGPLAPATLGICIKKLVNHYFFLVLDITALEVFRFHLPPPVSCGS